MSWEDQGPQFHQWFGHGTAGGSGAAAPGDAAVAIGAAAVTALGPVRGAALGRMLAEGGLQDLRDGLPIWAGAAGLGAGRFRALVVGQGLGAGAAASLQAMARASRDGDVAAAGRHLAAALAGEREGRWRYGLNYARDKAVYAASRDLVPAANGQGGVLRGSDEGEVPPSALGPLRRLQGSPPEVEGKGGVLKGGPRGGRAPREGNVTGEQARSFLPDGMSPTEFGRLARLGQGVEGPGGAKAAAMDSVESSVAALKAANVSHDAIEAYLELYKGLGGNLTAPWRVIRLTNILARC